MNIILSTSGHIDHGKTYLIEKLTGKNTMHHKEEILRNITIDLGYSFISIDGLNVSIIDVPGHKDYLKNTICGIINSNISMLVISSVDGVCRQTEEHFEIINYSSIDNLIIAITKMDLCTKEQLQNTLNQIDDMISSSKIKNIKILQIDYKKPLDELKKTIFDFSKNISFQRKTPYDVAKIDNSFSIKGHGTVVSGNLLSGSIEVGQSITIYPAKLSSKIRLLQSDKRDVNQIDSYARVAINLPSLSLNMISRGDVLSTSDNLDVSYFLEACVHLTKKLKSVKNHAKVKLLTGTSKLNGDIVYLEDNKAEYDHVLVQLRLKEPQTFFVGDDIIILDTFGEIVTGGVIINPLSYKFSRYDVATKTLVDKLRHENKIYLTILSIINAQKITDNKYLNRYLCLSDKRLPEIIEYFVKFKYVVILGNCFDLDFYIIKSDYYSKIVEKISNIISDYKNKYRYRNVLNMDIIFSNISYVKSDIIKKILEKMEVKTKGNFIILKQDVNTRKSLSDYHNILSQKIKNSSSVIKIKEIINDDENLKEILYNDLSDLFVRLDGDHIMSKDMYNAYFSYIREHFSNNERLTINQFKQRFDISRNVAVLILEFFDSKKITKRFDNYRIKLYND